MHSAWIAILLGLSVARVAAASPQTDIEARVQDAVAHIEDEDKFDKNFGPGAVLIGEHGTIHGDYTISGKAWPMVFGAGLAPSDVTKKLGKVTVVVDPKAATGWFQAPLDVTIAGAKAEHRAMHVSGFAQAKQGVWTLQILQMTIAVADKNLADIPVLVAQPPGKPDTDTTLGKAVASWFLTSSLAKHAASGDVLAGGTAPAELQLGAAARKMAATWDGLKLLPAEVHATDGSIVASAILWLKIPPKKGVDQGYIQLQVTVYPVKERGDWRWKSLQFVATEFPSRD